VRDVDTVIQGRAYVLPPDERDNVNTDTIIPPEHLTRFDQVYLGRHAMDGLRGLNPGDFASTVTASGMSILVAGENFGCGSMRAHAVYALGGAGVRAVVATSYARTFYRNAVNSGYLIPVTVRPDVVPKIRWNDALAIDLQATTVRNVSTNERYAMTPFHHDLRRIIDAGGLAEFNKRRRERKGPAARI
jgi:3-isopropylmalate/(R)-2-methylmalate dehydratase small subunit